MNLESGNTFVVTVGPFSQVGNFLSYYVQAQDNANNIAQSSSGLVDVRDCVSYALVKDEDGNPIPAARVYRNGVPVSGVTSSAGLLQILNLEKNDELVARIQVDEVAGLEVAGSKGNHKGAGDVKDWAYRVYFTSLDIPKDVNPSPYKVTDPYMTHSIKINKKNPNVLIGFNIVVSVEWDAPISFLDVVKKTFEDASKYLYDASNGQMLFEQVTIFDNSQFWADSDYQIHAREFLDPAAYTDRSSPVHIHFGRNFTSGTVKYQTVIHEFGHYGLGLYDSNYYSEIPFPIERDPQWARNKTTRCTAERQESAKLETNATIMDHEWDATEFSMQDLPGAWSEQCKKTYQWQRRNKSDWETIVDFYRDKKNSPPKWILKTPKDFGGVVRGPTKKFSIRLYAK